jgi:UDP-N-acetylglucosamine diphosphorylase/glucosamine-1-phosphate N-acetyltransferase
MAKRDYFKNTCAVILAAGKGKRMKSNLPKVMHKIRGRPLIDYLVSTLEKLKFPRIILVVGYKKKMIFDFFKHRDFVFVEQKELLGTGHAVLQTKKMLEDFNGEVLVLFGDVPFISGITVENLVRTHQKTKAQATVLTAVLDQPKGYGRIIRRKDGSLEKIVEDEDASPKEKKIKEINTGIFCFNSRYLFPALQKIKKDNQQSEYYLTDTVDILRKQKHKVSAFVAQDPKEILGVNSMRQLRFLDKLMANNKI